MDTTKKCNETDNFSDVIFTPHFRGDRYLHHVCSGCEYKVKIGNDVFNKLYFGETFKFCPNCGNPVIRFAKIPVFEESINRALFSAVEKIHEDMEDRVKYYLHVDLDDTERKELVDKARFAISLEEAGGPIAGHGARMIVKYGYTKLSHWDKKRLKERVGDGLSKSKLD